MKTKNQKILLFLLATLFISPVVVSAQGGGTDQLTQLVTNVNKVIFTASLGIVTIGWVIAGILWLTSGGSPEKTGTAKKATFAALIGTVLIVLASTAVGIYQVIINALTKGL